MKIIHASKIGFPCDRNLFYSVNNFALEDVPQITQRIFDTGSVLEPFIVKCLQNDGWNVDYNQGSQSAPTEININIGGGFIKGHHDCIISRDNQQNILVDIKTMNDRSFRSWKKNGSISDKPQYVDQIHCYAFGLLKNNVKIDRLGIVGFNKNNSDIHIDFFDFDPQRMAEILDRATNIFSLNEPPEQGERFTAWSCKYCGYKNICELAGKKKDTKVENNALFTDDDDIIYALNQLYDSRELNKSAKELEDEAKEILDEKVREQGFKTVQGGNFILTLSESVSNRIDSKALKKEFPEIAQKFTKESRAVRYDLKEAF